MKKQKISDYKVVIFDLDGTLYYQKPFRLHMLFFLLKYVLCHPVSIKDILIIKKYREIRENWAQYEEGSIEDLDTDFNTDLDTRQYMFVAKQMKLMKVSAERVKKAVSFFMLEAPLTLLPKYRDDELANMINRLKAEKITTAVYSDYPVEEKLAALGICVDACFTSADKEIGCMKPDPRGLQYILSSLHCKPEEAILIGDRYEKDGLAAIGNKMDYVILSASAKKRHEECKELFS